MASGSKQQIIGRNIGRGNEANVTAQRLWVDALLSGSAGSFTPLTASGSLAAPGTLVSLNPEGYAAVAIQLSGTWTGAVSFQASLNGTDFFNINSRIYAAAPIVGIATGSSVNCIAIMPVQGAVTVRAEATAVGSGTIEGTMRAIPGAPPDGLVSILGQATGAPIGDSLVTPISVQLSTPGSVPFTLDLPTGTTPAASQRGLISLFERADIPGVLPAGVADGDLGRPRLTSRGAQWVQEMTMRNHFSASTGGQPIQIAQVATLGDTIHTATSDGALIDRLWIYVTNTSNTEQTITFEWGTAGAGNQIKVPVPCNDTILAIPGVALGGEAFQVVTAFATLTNVLNVFGYFQREQSAS